MDGVRLRILSVRAFSGSIGGRRWFNSLELPELPWILPGFLRCDVDDPGGFRSFLLTGVCLFEKSVCSFRCLSEGFGRGHGPRLSAVYCGGRTDLGVLRLIVIIVDSNLEK